MGYTFVQKVIERHTGKPAYENDCVVVEVDVAMASDTTAPIAIQAFEQMGGQKLAKPNSTVLVIDHAVPCPNERIANLHQRMRKFAEEKNCVLYDHNAGVCHQKMIEDNRAKEGDIVLGADSHTCSYGAVGAFSTGVGSTDLGGVLLTGKTWLKVPETIKITLEGKLPDGVGAKDIILTIIGDIGSDGANYKAVEFHGEGFARLSKEEAITICNMTIEMGGKSGVFIPAITDINLMPDSDAKYAKELHYKAEDIVPVLACPHTVDNVCPVNEVAGRKIDLVYIGSCTNGRLSDIKIAADILRGKTLAKGTRMIVCPASDLVMKAAIEMGYITDLITAGVAIVTPGCGLCVGTLGGVPADGERIISTTNRNFLGRMGNNKAEIYLASPQTAVLAALKGCITDPRDAI